MIESCLNLCVSFKKGRLSMLARGHQVMADNGATSNENPLNTPSTSSQSTLATASSSTTIAKPTGTATGTPKGNPAFRALGLPNFRFKLPSRNWLIFLTITGSWTGALLYDRRAKRKAQNKWCTLVSHIAKEPLPTNTLPRRVTIYLAAPPGDGLRSAREHFVEYVKPVLVAAALDWDVVEGRREGDIRAGLAERIRRFRRTKGDVAETPLEEDVKLALERIRTKDSVFQGPSLIWIAILGSGLCLDQIYLRTCRNGLGTFFASFLFFRCFDADAFWIFWRNRTGTRFDFGSINQHGNGFGMLLHLLPTFIVLALLYLVF